MFEFVKVPYIVDCVSFDMEVRKKFKFDVGPGRNVDVQNISGMIEPVNSLTSETKLEIS